MSLRSLLTLVALTCTALLAAACSDEVPAPPTPTSSASPMVSDTVTPTPVPQPPLPEALAGMKVVPLELGPPVNLPNGVALIIETGCYGCSGAPSGLVRLYQRPDGSLAYEDLIDREQLGVPPQLNTADDGHVYEFRSPLTGYAIRPDASQIVASLCAQGRCGRGGGHYEWTPDSVTAIFSSTNGGISWAELGRLNVGAEVLAILPDGRILLQTYPRELTTAYLTYPDLSEFRTPMTVASIVMDLPNGEPVWQDNSCVTQLSDGRRLLPFAQGVEPCDVIDFIVPFPGADGLVLIRGNETQPPYTHYVAPFDSAGAIGRGAFAVAGDSVIWSGTLLRLGVALPGGNTILGNASVPTDEIAPNGVPVITDFDPVVVDLEYGTQTVLSPFIGPAFSGSRNYVVAAQKGPFARVVNTGVCLNIREAPTTAASVRECAADGVLLTVPGTPSSVPPGVSTEGWLEVISPSGTQGWASTQFLEH